MSPPLITMKTPWAPPPFHLLRPGAWQATLSGRRSQSAPLYVLFLDGVYSFSVGRKPLFHPTPVAPRRRRRAHRRRRVPPLQSQSPPSWHGQGLGPDRETWKIERTIRRTGERQQRMGDGPSSH